MAQYQGKLSTYELTANPVNKVFHAEASGFFSIEDGQSFLRDYDQETKLLPANTYTLIIDAPELKPSSPEVAALLGTLLQKYMEVPFKARFLVTKGSVITLQQFKRIGKDIPGWTESVQYVDNYEDALKAMK